MSGEKRKAIHVDPTPEQQQARLDEINAACAMLALVMGESPTLRIWQMLENVAGERSLYQIEDDELIALLVKQATGGGEGAP